MSRATVIALSFVSALALSSGAMAQGGGGGGGGAGGGGTGGGGTGGASSGAGGAAGNAGTAGSGNNAAQPPVARAARVAILRPSPPAARARIASIPQALELDRDQPGPASGHQAAAQADRDSDERNERYQQRTRAAPHPLAAVMAPAKPRPGVGPSGVSKGASNALSDHPIAGSQGHCPGLPAVRSRRECTVPTSPI
jgi:hypothetical protein